MQDNVLSYTKALNHFFLLHDFFLKLTQIKPLSSSFFDLQYDVSQRMKNASIRGSNIGITLPYFCMGVYFVKSPRTLFKVLVFSVVTYWIRHFETFGQYICVSIALPGVYKSTADYFTKHMNQSDYFLRLNNLMETQYNEDHTNSLLAGIFQDQIQEKKHYVINSFFIDNKQQFFSENSDLRLHPKDKNLKYFNCFVTRYVYHTFIRWLQRMSSLF